MPELSSHISCNSKYKCLYNQINEKLGRGKVCSPVFRRKPQISFSESIVALAEASLKLPPEDGTTNARSSMTMVSLIMYFFSNNNNLQYKFLYYHVKCSRDESHELIRLMIYTLDKIFYKIMRCQVNPHRVPDTPFLKDRRIVLINKTN